MTAEDEGPPRTGLRIGWLVFVLLVCALLVSGWFIVADRMNAPVAGRPTVPPMLGGSGTITKSPPGSPPKSPPGQYPSAEAPIDPSAEPPVRGDSVAGVDTVRTIACDDNAVSISGVRNTVTVTGYCTRVDVSGVNNVVTIENAGAIDVSGIRNRVQFRSGSPELSKSGIDNTLERG